MCSCNSILECCIMFSEVKLSVGSFVLLLLSCPKIFDITVKETKTYHTVLKGSLNTWMGTF